MAAAITSPWSNGQTEGQITKLKLVKRRCIAAGTVTSSKLASSARHKLVTTKSESESDLNAYDLAPKVYPVVSSLQGAATGERGLADIGKGCSKGDISSCQIWVSPFGGICYA